MSTTKAIHVQEPPMYSFLGVAMEILLSGAQTGGEFSLIAAIMPPGGDGGLHMHTREDEAVYLIEGSLDVTIGEDTFTLRAGQSYFAPRNVPHRLQNTGHVPARALLVNTPETFDAFVRRAGIPAGQATAHPGAPDDEQIEQLLALAEEFGVKVLAPPGA